MASNVDVIVVGGLNTDIVAHGVSRLLSPGEHTYGDKIIIGPGGKSRNIAQMIATLSGKGRVAMLGKTAKDSFGLWKIPLQSLKKSGVTTNYISILPQNSGQFPAIALIPVDRNGQNQIYVLPGVTNTFLPHDIKSNVSLFQNVGKRRGFLVSTLEMPLETVIASVKLANSHNLSVFLDPGGIEEGVDYSGLVKHKIFLIKPNEHEAKILTGITVKDEKTAKRAAAKLFKVGIGNVFITLGKNGAYFITHKTCTYLPVPQVEKNGAKDETGCGDQTFAATVAALLNGDDIGEAVRTGMVAGTLQFGKSGIQPVTKSELERARRGVKSY